VEVWGGGGGEIKRTWTFLQYRKQWSCKLLFSRGLAWCVPTLFKCHTSAHIFCTTKTMLLLGDGINKTIFNKYCANNTRSNTQISNVQIIFLMNWTLLWYSSHTIKRVNYPLIINLAQYRDKWQNIMNTVTNLLVSQNSGHFLTGGWILRFSRRRLPHGVRLLIDISILVTFPESSI